MQIDNPEQLLRVFDALIKSMDRAQRVKLLHWFKILKNDYDMNYPLGYKPEELKDDKQVDSAPSDVVQSSVQPSVGLDSSSAAVPSASNGSGGTESTTPIQL